MATTEEKLDQLAEFESQRDSLEAQKSALLAENKVPAEIQEIVNDGMRRMNAAPTGSDEFEKSLDAEFAALVVPDEIRDALAKIDAQRAEINNRRMAHQREANAEDQMRRENIQTEINAATAKVYADIAARKAEIEAEFAGNLDAVNGNIEILKTQIKTETVSGKKTVKGKYYQSIYTAGRITWNTDMMEGWRETFPFLEKARKEGAPSTQLRRI